MGRFMQFPRYKVCHNEIFCNFISKLNNMELIELKAQAYDILSNLEYLQKQLQEVNQKIAQKLQEEKAGE